MDLLLYTQKAAIESLENLIEEIRSGDVVEFIGMKIMASGGNGFVGGCTDDRHKMAGMLMDLAMARLRQSSDEEEE